MGQLSQLLLEGTPFPSSVTMTITADEIRDIVNNLSLRKCDNLSGVMDDAGQKVVLTQKGVTLFRQA